MTQQEMLALAEAEGFRAALIDTAAVPVNAAFRPFCEENRCGQYNANFSCPPDCGTPEQMHEKILAGDRALVLKKERDINGYTDYDGIREGKAAHNSASMRLMKKLRESGIECAMAGSSCCSLCQPCRKIQGEACKYPELQFSCMSAYCVDVAKLAELCDLGFAWDESKLYSYGMLIFKSQQTEK